MDSELRDDLLEDEFEGIEANEEADDMPVEFDPFADLSDEELDAMVEAAGDAGAAYGLVAGDTPEGFRSGFVALVGRPNAGKSTLLNACVGTKVAITSPVAQTTRRRMRAVVNRDDFQLVFVDTPGIHKPKDGLGSELNRSALAELSDVDVIAFVIDASVPVGRGDAWVAERVRASRATKILVLTKADKVDQAKMMQQIEAARALVDFDDVIVVSATEGFNVEPFIELMASYLPEGPRWYPEGMDTDTDDATLVAEFVREKVLLRTREEVPHSVGVVCDSFERSRKLVRVHATVYVERDGQKGILIGRKGEMIKHIGTDARHDLERLFGRKVYLELDVKVKPGWRDDAGEIRRMGYAFEE
ncbi:GTPase Era [Collinsella tanakaei]|uniref:GTPase Era n=1 Tax=Collinsella tanakaei TaxID=626935 RepID=UPI0025A3EFC7|nr:GTPase Era [Collinsella tanakaei]MDM8245182.1 GTPase Era [Collinsella tanakaei]